VTHDRDEFRRRAIRAVIMVAGIAAAIGLVIGLLAAGVVYLSGAVPDERSEQTVAVPAADHAEEVPSPVLSPTASPSPRPAAQPSTQPSTQPSDAPTASASRSTSSSSASAARQKARAKQTRDGRRRARRSVPSIRLHAGKARVGRYERVALRGRYTGGNRRTLAVQRFEGGTWRRFPTSATVRGGTFSTYVASGRPGPNRFRVVDRGRRASNIVVVRVR
jgi:hypothetical protein